MSGYRDMQRSHRMGCVPSDAPPRFSPLTAPTPGVGVSTYKSREGTIGEKVMVGILKSHLTDDGSTESIVLYCSR